MAKKILVTGALGTVGREVVSTLLAMGQSVRVLTRNRNKSSFPEGVEVFEGDLSKPPTLSGLFTDIASAHFIAFNGADYKPLDTGFELIQLLKAANVRRLTILWNGEGKVGTLEQAARESNLEWTILEPQEYMANVLGWAPAIREQQLVEEPCINRPTAAIHEKDLAAVISHILVHGRHSNKTYALTGPEVLSPQIQVATISEAIGKAITLRELNETETRKRWKDWGIPKHTQDYLYGWYSNTPAVGYTVTNHVETIIGRPALNFRKWVQDHIGCFR